MLPVVTIIASLSGQMTAANLQLFSQLIVAFFTVRYQVTTRGLSRYCDYSVRQIFRFLKGDHPWLAIRLTLFKTFCYSSQKRYIAAVDEVVEGKSGKRTHGLSRFYSSSAQKSISGICFFGLSLIDVASRVAYTVGSEQVVYTEEDKRRHAESKKRLAEGRKRVQTGTPLAKGRKPGSKNKDKSATAEESASLRTFKVLWGDAMKSLPQMLPDIHLSHLVADSAYGTLMYLRSAQQYGCCLISKLKSNAALYSPYAGQQKERGRRRIYGQRIDIRAVDEKHLHSTTIKDGETSKVYQFAAYSKTMPGVLLNVVVIVTIRSDGKQGLAVVFSNDTSLDAATMIDYYRLRFQIEFEFRDAKQHFGLSDFKNYKKENLTTMVNMCFTIDIISKILLASYRKDTGNHKISVLDLKILFHARFQAQNIIKLLRKQGYNISYSAWIDQYYPIDMVNAA